MFKQSLKPYEKYKSSNIEWIGDIPEHWGNIKLKHIFKERTQKGYPNEPLLAATQTKGVVPKEMYENKTVIAVNDLQNLKLVEKGDFVISLRSFQGGIEIAHYRGIISPAYTVMTPHRMIYGHYFKFLFKSKGLIENLNVYVTGIRQGQNIDYSKFKNSIMPLPPISEQKTIAEYLNRKIQQAEILIEKQTRLVKLLIEEIYSIVVGDVRSIYRPSGDFEWTTFFPKEWTFIKGKRLFIEKNIRNKPNERLVAITQERGAIYKDEIEENYVSPTEYEKLKLVDINDFILSLRSFQGGIELSKIRGIVSPAYNIFHLRKNFDDIYHQTYYKYLFKSPQFITLLNTVITGIRDGKNISFKDFSTLLIPIPDKKTVMKIVKLDKSLKISEKKIKSEKKLINEYLQSLIYQVVTGQLEIKKESKP